MAVSSRQLTYEEWLDFPTPEGLRTELIDGEVGVAPEPTGPPVVYEAPGTLAALALPDLMIDVADVFAD